jgi:hypothetical protein
MLVYILAYMLCMRKFTTENTVNINYIVDHIVW